MNGSDLGRAVAGQLAVLVIGALVAGGALALGGYFVIGWLVANVSVSVG